MKSNFLWSLLPSLLLCLIFTVMLAPQVSAATSASIQNNAHSELPFTIKGELTQGSLIRGQASVGTQLQLNGKSVDVNAQGLFAFGFGRDAKPDQTLSWKLPDDTSFESITLSLQIREYDIQRIEGVAKKYVSPPKEVTQRIRQDNVKIAQARAVDSQLSYFNQSFILPSKGRISGVYGSQRVFNGEPRRPHFGLDVAGPVGTPVVAPADGIITLVHDDMYYSGGTLLMDHGMGVSSTFIHLSKLHVKEGQAVKQGDLIAEIGATGRVTGPHLDWRINWFKERLDPALLVDVSDVN